MNPKADLILRGGDLRTQDPGRPRARAAAIAGRRFLALGGDDEIMALAGPDTQVYDLKGRLVLPGFWDAHIHYYDWALGQQRLDLARAGSLVHLLEKVRVAAASRQAGQWIVGQSWNEAEWPDPRLPDRGDLDQAAPDHPVALWRCDMHLASVNSQALHKAGLDRNTTDPPEGMLDRDAQGRLTGILRESAAFNLRQVIPQPGADELVDVFVQGLSALHALGVTGLHDNRVLNDLDGGARNLRTWQRLRQENRLPMRVWFSLAGEALNDALTLGLRTGLGDDYLRLGHLKFFADGGMGARTAWMIEPYLDAEHGLPLWDMEELAETVARADQSGLAVMIHAIGDRAVREVLDIFQKLRQNRFSPASGPAIAHRLEHVQMIRPEDAARLGQLDLAMSVQPANMIIDINTVEASVGDLGRLAYAFRSVFDSGAPVLIGSDAPVADPSPLVNIQAAVTRQRMDGTPTGGWHPEQRLTVAEAVRAYTATAAQAYGQGRLLGSLTPGKLADLIVLDRNIFNIAPQEINDTRVDLTVFDGRVVYRR